MSLAPSAVMQSRRSPIDGLDYFPTPPWGTRALTELVLKGYGIPVADQVAEEPSCGEGDMALPLAEAFRRVHASDIYPYGHGEIGDYLDDTLGTRYDPGEPVDWSIFNPPFNAALDFVRVALRRARVGVAALCRMAWIETRERYALFSEARPAMFCPFVERLPMVEGRLDPDASSATPYAWFVWIRGDAEFRVRMIEPCKARLDRPADWTRERPLKLSRLVKPVAAGALL